MGGPCPSRCSLHSLSEHVCHRTAPSRVTAPSRQVCSRLDCCLAGGGAAGGQEGGAGRGEGHSNEGAGAAAERGELSGGESSATVFSTKSSELSSFAAAKLLLSSQMERKLNMETVLYLPPEHLNLYSCGFAEKLHDSVPWKICVFFFS